MATCGFNRRVCSSMTDSKCSEIHLRVTSLPGSCPPPSSPLGAAGSAVTTAYRPPYLRRLTHPFTLPPPGPLTDRVRRDSRARSVADASLLITAALCPAITFGVLPSSASRQAASAHPVHLSPARGTAPYTPPTLRAVLWPRFKMLHFDGTRKVFLKVYSFIFIFFKVLCDGEFTLPAYSSMGMPSSLLIILPNQQEVTFYLQEGYICCFPESFCNDYSMLLHWSWPLEKLIWGQFIQGLGQSSPGCPGSKVQRHLVAHHCLTSSSYWNTGFCFWKLKKKEVLQQKTNNKDLVLFTKKKKSFWREKNNISFFF